MSEVQIIASGPVGSGKSALLGEIEIMCRALGISVRYADEAAAQAEKNMTHADWTAELEMYKPSVVLVEDQPWRATDAAEQVQDEVRNQVLEDAARQVEAERIGFAFDDMQLNAIAAAIRAMKTLPAAAQVQTDAARDTALLDALDAWIKQNEAAGYHDFHFEFDTKSTARVQLAADDEIRALMKTATNEGDHNA